MRLAGRVIAVYEGVLYKEIVKIPPFRSFIKSFFFSRPEYKNGGNVILEQLINCLWIPYLGNAQEKI